MQLSPADARMYWLAERIHSDQFLLFAFATATDDVDSMRRVIRDRAVRIGDLRSAIREVPGNLDFPYWAPRAWDDGLVVEHRLDDPSWPGCQAALGRLVATSLDARTAPWRLHVFPRVSGVPGHAGEALVVVFQVAHAFADGRRATALARALFSRESPASTVAPPSMPATPLVLARASVTFLRRFLATVRAARRSAEVDRALREATSRGEVPSPAPGFELSAINVRPGPGRVVRMVVRPASGFRAGGVTVTVAALTAVSVALPRLLASLGGAVPERLGAEVTISVVDTVVVDTAVVDAAVVDTAGRARNGYRNAGVDLFVTEPDLCVRAGLVADELAARRARLSHPLLARRDEVDDHVPAPLTKLGIDRADLDAVPATVTGNTVVSSVSRGANDLEFSGGAALFSSGFPGLSPVMGLTHGVYGLGDTVTIGICASPEAVPDVDAYASMLGAALDEVAAALASGTVTGTTDRPGTGATGDRRGTPGR